jgi:allantoinase
MTVVIVKNGYVFTNEGFRDINIRIKDGRITSLFEKGAEPSTDELSTIIDASGCMVVPGFIDAHVHFNDPGRTNWEGFETGTRAAAIGGTTTIFDMPLNSFPSVTNTKALGEKREHVSTLSHIDYAFWGGMTADSLTNKKELTAMSKEVIAWKAFMCESGIDDFRYLSLDDLGRAMQLAKDYDQILALHAEMNGEILRNTDCYKNRIGMNEHRAFLASRPESAEVIAVSKVLEMALKYGTSVHLVHISTRKAVELIQQAKKSGVNVTVETCPHYLIFDEEDFVKTGALLKCAPPLRPRTEVEGLWECINNGWIDTIGSDHSPCLYEMKMTSTIWEAWGGIQGVQFTWLALQDEALKRKIPLKRIIPLGTSNPADRFRIAGKKGRIQPGLDADFVLIRLDETTLAERNSFAFRNPFSPYENRTFSLKVKKTILRGKVIYDDQIGLMPNKFGEHIQPKEDVYG